VNEPSPLRARRAFSVEVVRSSRRTRTVGAQLLGSVLRVTVPAWMSRDEERRWVEEMSRRFDRKLDASQVDLADRARILARRFRLPEPESIDWVDNMRSRWGSCTPSTGHIRISARLSAFPDWVRDYVIVHELAHLAIELHTPAFWALVARYPRAERARGYLIAKSGDDEID
jgi:predicted metal-dependent hydrolase